MNYIYIILWFVWLYVVYILLYYFRKNIEINVIDDEEYEKKEIFYVVFGELKVVKNEDDDSGVGIDISYDVEKERFEELGKFRLGIVIYFYKCFII